VNFGSNYIECKYQPKSYTNKETR